MRSTALVRRDTPLAQTVIAADARLDVLQREVEEQRHPHHRPAPAARGRPARDHLGHPRLGRRRAHRRSRQEHRQARARHRRAVPAAEDRRRRPAHERSRARPAQGRARRLRAARTTRSRARRLARDGAIDALYTSLFRELLTYMMEDPRNISFCTHLLFCAKNIERIGDHTTNIAETVHYLVTGRTRSTSGRRTTGRASTTVEAG